MGSTRPEALSLPPDAGRLRVPPPAPYVYRSRLKRAAARTLDFGGGLLFSRRPGTPDWGRVGSVAVLRLDHLGDLLHLLPFLRRLRTALPAARLDLWTGPWGAELAGYFADVDRVLTHEAPWFRRPERVEWPWASILGLARELKRNRYDAAFEPRGDLRHHLALYAAGIPLRAGQALTAGGFLLSHPARWNPGLHEQEQALSLADQAGVPAGRTLKRPYLRLPDAARREAEALAMELKLGASVVMVQAACGTQAKRWNPGHWASLLDRLGPSHTVCLLGSESERGEMQALAAGLKRPPRLATGRLGLGALAAFLTRARLLISVDSGPAHLAAVQGVPVLSLFSGTNRAAQWAPRGGRVEVLQAQGLPCSPCELALCPYDNACMRALSPDDALAAARRLLRKP